MVAISLLNDIPLPLVWSVCGLAIQQLEDANHASIFSYGYCDVFYGVLSPSLFYSLFTLVIFPNHIFLVEILSYWWSCPSQLTGVVTSLDPRPRPPLDTDRYGIRRPEKSCWRWTGTAMWCTPSRSTTRGAIRLSRDRLTNPASFGTPRWRKIA